ncbi:hypothetical protein SAMN02745181_3855 [Rubritalea squalenifaciens DSM 18772]|uniref:Nucleotidyl transferase AbiEii toxin, Type IV TA system n=1 Tax=Rubritalea squalenifaciens DSM 18772 TaxID=1123071 RepID=A0A1M6SPM7_9BACT|nr:hypothetical protein SAMN02745181_3855 [Rubritalea squalenifaciens DSM 18772]
MDELTAKIGKALADKLDGFKFVKSQWHLIRKTEVGSQSIVIEVLPTSDPETAKLAAHGHVRIDEIEDGYTPHNPYLTPKDAKAHPTIVVNCDQLLSDKSLANGFRVDEQSINQFVDVYARALEGDVLPWLNKYSDEGNLFENLSGEDPKSWITSDRLIRYPVLLAMLAKKENWARFEQIGEEFLNYCDQPHAQVYKPLAASVIEGLKGV